MTGPAIGPVLRAIRPGDVATFGRVALVIRGEPASKANSRALVTFGRGEKARPALIKSEKARDYEAAAVLQIPHAARAMFTGRLRVTMTIFYASERPDLDESVVLDVLQAHYSKKDQDGHRDLVRAGVYVNDRQVRERHVFHAIDKANPRAEIVVEALEPQQTALLTKSPRCVGFTTPMPKEPF